MPTPYDPTTRLGRQRKAIKSRIAKHPDWPALRRANDLDLRRATAGEIVAILNKLGLDVDDLLPGRPRPAATTAAPARDPAENVHEQRTPRPMTDKQRAYIESLRNDRNAFIRNDESDDVKRAAERYQQGITILSAEASAVIGALRVSIGQPRESRTGSGRFRAGNNPGPVTADEFNDDDETETSTAAPAAAPSSTTESTTNTTTTESTDTMTENNTAPAATTGSDEDRIQQYVSSLLGCVASGDFDKMRKIAADQLDAAAAEAAEAATEAAKAAAAPAQITTRTRTVTVDSDGNEIKPAVDPQPAGYKTARELWPYLDASAETYGFQCFDYDDGSAAADEYDMTDLHETGALRLVSVALRLGHYAWLSGHKATGKTQFCRELARATGRPFVRIGHTGAMEQADILGMRDGLDPQTGKAIWTPGVLLQAIDMAQAIILLDEVTNAPESVISVYQQLTDEGYWTAHDTGRRHYVRDGVAFFVADNTRGTGDASGLYQGAREVNAAARDRFACMLEFDYLKAATEVRMLRDRAGCTEDAARELVGYANRIRAAVIDGDMGEPLSTRRLIAAAQYLAAGIAPETVMEAAIFGHVTDDGDAEQYRQLANAHLTLANLAH